MANKPPFFAAALSLVLRVIRWIGGHELVVLLSLAGVAGGIWGFVELADQVSEGETQAFDEWVVRSLRRPNDPTHPIGPDWTLEVGRDLTALGGVVVLGLVTAAVMGFLLLSGKFGAMFFVFASTSTGLVLSTLLKHSFDRPRPNVVPHLSYVYTSSFPSGHSLMSAVVYLSLGALLARLSPRLTIKFYFLSVAFVLTTLVGISRVYMGVHYPTDVLAGWTAGSVWAAVCWLVARALQRRGAVEEQMWPGDEGDLPRRPAKQND